LKIGELRKKIPAKIIAMCLYPGWLDVIVVFLLWRINSTGNLGEKEMILLMFLSSVARYGIQILLAGFIYFAGKDWYILQTIYIALSLSCFFMYSREEFVWVFSFYFSILCMEEMIVSIVKGK
jgi:hypothetical protein